MDIITRAAARAAGLKTYFTGKTCPKGHVAERRTDSGNCVCCDNERRRQYHAENAEAEREYNRQWRANNLEAERERNRRYYAENPEYYRQYYADNLEAVRESQRQYAANNPHKINARNAKRRSAKLQRTPQWLTRSQLEQIEAFYKQAKDLTDLSGTEHHVDHIVPLQGKTVSGLHVPWNLQVITAKDNISKSNKLGP